MTALHASRSLAETVCEQLRIYAQPQRLMILSRLVKGEHTVGQLEAATEIGQPALSQQLAELRRGELVNSRRVAKQVFYRLADEKVRLCVQSIDALFGSGADLASLFTSGPAPEVPLRPESAASFAVVG